MKAKDIGIHGNVVAMIKSNTTDSIYAVRLDGVVYSCECLGFKASKSTPKQCIHIRKYREDKKC